MLNHHLVISNLGNNEEIMKMIDTLSLVPPSHLHTTRAAEIFICLIPSFFLQSNKMLTSQISKLKSIWSHANYYAIEDSGLCKIFFLREQLYKVEIHSYNHSHTHSHLATIRQLLSAMVLDGPVRSSMVPYNRTIPYYKCQMLSSGSPTKNKRTS